MSVSSLCTLIDQLFKAIGREALKEKTPSLQELEQTPSRCDVFTFKSTTGKQRAAPAEVGIAGRFKDESRDESGMPLVAYLMQKGYLKDSPKWLSAKGFTANRQKILSDVMKALKASEYSTLEVTKPWIRVTCVGHY